MARRTLVLLLIVQACTHLLWLSPSAHSGQVAIPWLMNQGMALFGDIWEQHAPGSSLLSAAGLAVLPLEAGPAVKLLNVLLVLALTVLIYRLAQRLTGLASAGICAALVWAWWAPVYGNVLFYFDSLLALCVLAAVTLFCAKPGRPSARQIASVGLLLGAATLFKQHAWLAAAVMGVWLLRYAGRRSLLIYGVALLLLPLAQWAVLMTQGLWENYLFWNWTFNLSGYMDAVPLDGDFFRKLLLSNVLVLPFVALAWRAGNRRDLLLAVIWLSTLSLLYPRFGEIHAMGHLPFTAVMSGIVLARLAPTLSQPGSWDVPQTVVAGLAGVIGLGWLWTGAVSYIPTPVGAGKILAWDEFMPLAAELNQRKDPGDTLYILPQTDSTPQLHPLTALPPPGTWIKGWRWYFRPGHVAPHLLAEWEREPPTWIVVFPAFIRDDDAGILTLLDWVVDAYELQFAVDDIYAHGRADVYRLTDGEP